MIDDEDAERLRVLEHKVQALEENGVGIAILELAKAINRLAVTQEKPKSKGAVSFSTAHFEDQPDAQTEELRNLQRQRGEGGEE